MTLTAERPRVSGASIKPSPEEIHALFGQGDLVPVYSTRLADLEPRDNIDIQSFIWIVGEYRKGDGASEGA